MYCRRSAWTVLLAVLMVVAGGCGESRGNGTGGPSGPVDTSPPVDTLEECGDFKVGDDLNVCTATYLGGEGDNDAVAVAIDERGRVFVAANWDTPPAPKESEVRSGEGPGALVVLSATGGDILEVLNLGAKVRTLSLNPTTNELAIGLADGLQVWNLTDLELVWEHGGRAVDGIAFDGDLLAVQSGATVSVYDGAGAAVTEIDVKRSQVNDIAVNAELGLIYITGFHQVSGSLQQPYLHAYESTGQKVWENWDWSAEEAGELSSDTRGKAINMGRDGKLYYAGESHGGVSTHFKNPTDLDEEAPVVRRDAYSQSHNWNGAAPLGFMARLDPATGDLEKAQLLAVRLSDGRGNGVSPEMITANEDGIILVGGGSACCIERWDEKKVAGQLAMPGYGGGQWVMALPPDFEDRPLWTTFHGGAPGARLRSVDARGPTMAVVHTHQAGDSGEVEGNMITTRSLTPQAPGGTANVHLVVFPSP